MKVAQAAVLDTILPADCVEVHHRSQMIAVGTYHLEDGRGSGRRTGRILLVDRRGEVVVEHSDDDNNAVFDVKWSQSSAFRLPANHGSIKDTARRKSNNSDNNNNCNNNDDNNNNNDDDDDDDDDGDGDDATDRDECGKIDDNILAVAVAAPKMRLDRLVEPRGGSTWTLQTIATIHMDKKQRGGEAKRMCVSVDWDRSQGMKTSIVVSHNDGMVSLVDPCRADVKFRWKAHPAYEVWSAAFIAADHLVWTGADDGLLKGWDLRQRSVAHDDDDDGLDGNLLPTFVNKNSHGGVGVCCIVPHPHNEYLVATGSYDESVRLWDQRQMTAPVARVPVGGGVWRAKWSHSDCNPMTMLTASMHNGFHLVEFDDAFGREDQIIQSNSATAAAAADDDDDGFRGRILAHFKGKHESLAYGCDWIDESTVACCSFYDHLFSINHLVY